MATAPAQVADATLSQPGGRHKICIKLPGRGFSVRWDVARDTATRQLIEQLPLHGAEQVPARNFFVLEPPLLNRADHPVPPTFESNKPTVWFGREASIQT